MSAVRSCPSCGYTHTYATAPIADTHHRRHSCAYQTSLAAAAVRREQRIAARQGDSQRRDCVHPGTPHVHGQRVTYVKDHCRCTACTIANTAASRAAKRQQVFGRYEPYIDAGPIRAHIQSLRSQGIGYERIARITSTSTSHIRELAGTVRRSANRPQIQRIRPDTARRILAIDPATSEQPAGSRIEATGTKRRLQALVALGWSTTGLAKALGRSSSSVHRTMEAARVLASTAERVRTLYDQLCLTPPPETTPDERASAQAARAWAHERGWQTSMAWDDIDADTVIPDQPTDPTEIDEIAVERAVTGDGIRLRDLTNAEQTEAVRRLTDHGKSIRDIAEQLATTTRTVSRRRGAAAHAA